MWLHIIDIVINDLITTLLLSDAGIYNLQTGLI